MKYLAPILLLAAAIIFVFSNSQDDKISPSEASTLVQNQKVSSPSITQSSSKRNTTKSSRKLQTENNKINSTKATIAQLKLACEDYYQEYQQLPLGSTSNSDTSLTTTSPLSSKETGSSLIAALIGLISSEEENYKLTSFLAAKTADDKKDGLHRTETTAELFDPWGNPYHLVLDYDYDQQIHFLLENQTHHDTKVLIWSRGPDGQSGTPETNKDNIYSWQ